MNKHHHIIDEDKAHAAQVECQLMLQGYSQWVGREWVDKPPTDLETYMVRGIHNQRMTGTGFEVHISSGCPFCGAPHFHDYLMLDVEKASEKPKTCSECGRSLAMVITKQAYEKEGRHHSETRMGFFQTGGPDPDSWCPFKPQRAKIDPPKPPSPETVSAHLTTNPDDPRLHEVREDGQNEVYLVLSEEERRKGFTRPYREQYVHKGERPKYPLRLLTEEEQAKNSGYTWYEEYPEEEAPLTGRFWTAAQMKSGCGQLTRMGRTLSETYARDPKFYGSTFCATCGKHFAVGEFVWATDGEVVGS